MALQPGSVFAGYRVERKVGVGGMGAVFLARHPRLPRNVALKVLAEGLGADPGFRARFEREAELAARLDHPNIVSVYDRGSEGDQLWIAMQFVDGVDVAHLVKQGPAALPRERALHILRQAARGLDNAHKHGLLHRDVKPANILVAPGDDDGEKVLVTDFGIARALDETVSLTQSGSLPATIAYAAPEQIEGRPVDHRVDIYSLGCTLYVMLTGSVPYPRGSQLGVMRAHLEDPPPRPTQVDRSLPPAIDGVIARALAKDPNARFQTCRELAAAATAAFETNYAATMVRPIFAPAAPGGFDPSVVSHPSNPSHPANPAQVSHPSHPSHPSALQPPAPPRKRSPLLKFGAIAAALAVVAGAIVALTVVTSGDDNGPTPPPTSGATTTTPVAAGAWQAHDYIVTAFPDLVPATPDGTTYQDVTCEPVDGNGEPMKSDVEVPVGRIRCGGERVAGNPNYVYVIECNADRTPKQISAYTDLVNTNTKEWSRNGSSGSQIVGDAPGPPAYGAIQVGFDEPSRNFCEISVFGGTTGAQALTDWWADAPL